MRCTAIPYRSPEIFPAAKSLVTRSSSAWSFWVAGRSWPSDRVARSIPATNCVASAISRASTRSTSAMRLSQSALLLVHGGDLLLGGQPIIGPLEQVGGLQRMFRPGLEQVGHGPRRPLPLPILPPAPALQHFHELP